VDVPFSEHRDRAAAKAFFRSAKAATGVTPDRVTTDGHDSYPRAIRTELGRGVRHRTSRYLNNRLEQDHRGLKGRYRPMRGFKGPRSAARFGRGHDELRNFLRLRSRPYQHGPADRCRLLLLRRTVTGLGILEGSVALSGNATICSSYISNLDHTCCGSSKLMQQIRRTRPILGFKRFVTARRTLAGVEALALLAKGQVRAAPANDISAQRIFVHQVFGLVA
jgi:transposase-like protein